MAQAQPGMSPEQIRENWCRVMYCQSAYRNPANQGRIYEYDIAQCEIADAHMQRIVSAYNETGRENLRKASVQRMTTIQYSTRDITRVLTACRETCSKLAKSLASEKSSGE